MRVLNLILTLLVPSVVFAATPFVSYVVCGRGTLTWNEDFVWYASALASAAAVTALCHFSPGRTWRQTALVVAGAVAVLLACFIVCIVTAVVGVGHSGFEPLMALAFHAACTASAAVLYRMSGRNILITFGAAAAIILAVHTWQYDLVTAAGEDDLARVRLLLAIRANHPQKGDALILAAWLGHVDIVRLLLERGADPNYSSPPGSWTPLHAACSFGGPGSRRATLAAVQRHLLDHGADPNAVGGGRTPLFNAVAHSLDTVKLLLDHGADLHARDDRGATCLLETVQHGFSDTEMIEFLLSRGADLRAVDAKGRGAMHYLVGGYLSEEMLEFFLARGFDIDSRDADGMTPLHLAAALGVDGDPDGPPHCAGYEQAAKVLLNNGADIAARDAAGRTPLHHFAAYNLGHMGLLKLLVGCGADPAARDEDGKTPLDLAAENPNPRIRKYLERFAPAESAVE